MSAAVKSSANCLRRARTRPGARAAAIATGALLVAFAAGCSTWHFGGADTAAKDGTDTAAKGGTDLGQQATLRAIGGSAVFGKVRVIDRGSVGSVLLSIDNLPPGALRIAFHETPNCSSPNGFSAGPAWAPAGKQPQDLMPILYVNTEGRIEAQLRVAGLHASGPDSVAGRSVVVYAGTKITDAVPDVPNERVACGVFEPARRPEF